ncbi:MAG TPA: hypothetical protein VNB89_04580 [Gemmatimonadaceae bacterium]|jgi:hypothetical protein|nr:hypothetical protein [Gemmatimonadaceae bacterium]
MSDSEHRRRFETWLAAEFRRPVAISADGPERVMALVRGSAGPARRRRRGATPAAAFAFAACVLGVIAFRMATLLVPTSDDRLVGADAGLRDTISAFRDSMEGTARLVGVAVIAPAAARIAVVHDFHGWDLRITPVAQRDERAVRNAAVSIAPGLHLSPVTRGAALDFADTVQSNSTADSVPERR